MLNPDSLRIVAGGPKVLLWDLETGMGEITKGFYQLKNYSNFENPDNVKHPVWIVCAAWQWLGTDIVASTSVLKDPKRFKNCYHDDYYVVKTLHSLLEEADILVAHNGDRFDWPLFNWRCVFHNLTPPKKPRLVDTLKIARKEFKSESNSLRYLARMLDVSEKDKSPDWQKIFEGDPEEIVHCERYCRQDIRALRALYLRLRPYSTSHVNLNAMTEGIHHDTCPKCLSGNLSKRGFSYTNAGKYQRYVCECGSWSTGKKNLKKVDIR